MRRHDLHALATVSMSCPCPSLTLSIPILTFRAVVFQRLGNLAPRENAGKGRIQAGGYRAPGRQFWITLLTSISRKENSTRKPRRKTEKGSKTNSDKERKKQRVGWGGGGVEGSKTNLHKGKKDFKRNSHKSISVRRRPSGLTFSWWGRYSLCLRHKPTELAHSFYSLLVSISVFMALSTVFHSINSPDHSPFSHSVLLVLFLLY